MPTSEVTPIREAFSPIAEVEAMAIAEAAMVMEDAVGAAISLCIISFKPYYIINNYITINSCHTYPKFPLYFCF